MHPVLGGVARENWTQILSCVTPNRPKWGTGVEANVVASSSMAGEGPVGSGRTRPVGFETVTGGE